MQHLRAVFQNYAEPLRRHSNFGKTNIEFKVLLLRHPVAGRPLDFFSRPCRKSLGSPLGALDALLIPFWVLKGPTSQQQYAAAAATTERHQQADQRGDDTKTSPCFCKPLAAASTSHTPPFLDLGSHAFWSGPGAA